MSKRTDGIISAVLRPYVSASVYGVIGRGVSDVKLNENGELIFIMSDGQEINLGKLPEASIPTASAETLGGVKIGENLKIDENGALSVDTASEMAEDNTKPITSGAVYTEVGNIEALLKAL